MQYLSDIMGLAFADDQLQGVAEGDEPALAAKRAHLAYMIDIDDGVAMHSLKIGLGEALLDSAKRLGGKQTLPGGDDPHQFSLGLKSEHFGGVQEEVFLAAPA